MLSYDKYNHPQIPVQWTARLIAGSKMCSIHVQAAGHPGNRSYGYAFDVTGYTTVGNTMAFSVDKVHSSFKGTDNVKSLASTLDTYHEAFLVSEGDTMPRLVDTKGNSIYWSYIGQEGKTWLEAEIKLREVAIIKEEAKKEPVNLVEVAMKTAESISLFSDALTKTKGATKMAKKVTQSGWNKVKFSKCRWVLNSGDTVLHIQIKGNEFNRSYGMALDIPVANFDRLDFGCPAFVSWMNAFGDKGVTSRSGTGRVYSRGFVTVGKNKAGQDAILFRYADYHQCNEPLRTMCGRVSQIVLDWIKAN
jgi:hypothetical protein